ncbi:hypothetical protein ACE0DR_25225 [Azotobacter sp. CWF10]
MSGSIPSLEISGALATLRLRRPDKANRLEEADLTALLDCLARIEAAPQVRVVLLRAEGGISAPATASTTWPRPATAGASRRSPTPWRTCVP